MLSSTIAVAPNAIGGRRAGGGSMDRVKSIEPKTATSRIGLRSINLASGARVSARKLPRATAAACSERNGSFPSSR